MSMLSYFIRPPPAARRAYSVFSKPGGGRYFNSAKPPKVVAPTTTTNKGKVDSSSSSSSPSDTQAAANEDVNSSQPVEGQPPQSPTAPLSFPTVNAMPQPHPPINPQELRVHQFFSLHRPLLTLHQPTMSIFETHPFNFPPPPPAPATANTATASSETGNVGANGMIDDPPEASAESDADAARLLARALVVNRVGASLAWEDTLKKLGLDVAESEGRAEEMEEAAREYKIYMDSTKRKRRKKMKKHKLKKRRRVSTVY
ncbi:hypothetical protein K474DRAFT_32463 [Panus rudis PR-1116 ss-1]|nr:hypothetical protein K474DRAFT_32463 [Panus rudis PR-1116 ss-1]